MDSPADFLARWHYAGLFGIILVEEAGVPLPVPGDLFIAAMGVLAHRQGAAFLPTVAVVTAATVLGATVLFLISRHAGRPLLVKVARRFGYSEVREARLEGWLLRHGAVAVVAGRHVPGLRIVMTVVAGVLRLPPATFVLGTFLAGMLWGALYFWIGYGLGAAWREAATRGLQGWVAAAGAAALGLALSGGLLWRWRSRLTRRRPPA
jgi:membrane-associated protein